MGKREPAEGSSSPSARLRVISARRSGTIGERLRIALSDGSSFLLPIDALLEPGIPVGELEPDGELEPEAADRLRELAQAYAWRSRALRLLGASAQTAAGLRRKLLARGAAPSAVEGVLGRLVQEGHIDDRAFARSWVRQRLERHPEGEGPLLAGLLRRGVSRELAREVVGALLDPEAERESAARLAEKLARRTGMTPQRLEASLRARGFSRAVIRELLAGD
jgi:SOS response regulatory protein OraA/RecX